MHNSALASLALDVTLIEMQALVIQSVVLSGR